jgi:hypothetical protein
MSVAIVASSHVFRAIDFRNVIAAYFALRPFHRKQALKRSLPVRPVNRPIGPTIDHYESGITIGSRSTFPHPARGLGEV